MRIISGKWRRRNLPVGDAQGLRPTGDRVRETLFNWLSPYVHGARCLDLFAGTGALGLEALSRGAAFVQFAENALPTAKQLSINLDTLKADSTEYALNIGDGLQWLNDFSGDAFDLVFLDPPFADTLWQNCCDLLDTKGALAQEALIYVESPSETKIKVPNHWHELKALKAGSVSARLFQYRK